MYSGSKKNIFVFAGMLVFITLFLLGRSYYSYANIEKGKQYGDWLIACEASAKDKKEKICYAVQSVFNKDKDNKEARLLELKIGYLGSGKNLQMYQILNIFGPNIQAGTSIIADNAIIAPGKFLTCHNYGCIASANIDNKDLAAILKAKDLSLAFFIFELGKQVNIKISNKGLNQALDALKKM